MRDDLNEGCSEGSVKRKLLYIQNNLNWTEHI
jgi:hypothetical protein